MGTVDPERQPLDPPRTAFPVDADKTRPTATCCFGKACVGSPFSATASAGLGGSISAFCSSSGKRPLFFFFFCCFLFFFLFFFFCCVVLSFFFLFFF